MKRELHLKIGYIAIVADNGAQAAFKSCAFTKCIIKFDVTTINNAKDLD